MTASKEIYRELKEYYEVKIKAINNDIRRLEKQFADEDTVEGRQKLKFQISKLIDEKIIVDITIERYVNLLID